MAGVYSEDVFEKLQYAAFDERFSIVGMLNGKLSEYFRNYTTQDRLTELIFEKLKVYKENRNLDETIETFGRQIREKKRAQHLTRNQEYLEESAREILETYRQKWKLQNVADDRCFEEEFAFIKERFEEQVEKREETAHQTEEALENVFCFLEQVFGESQEMAAFVTELNTNGDSIRYLRENDCPYYYKYNKGLLFDERRKEILSKMEKIEKTC